jgi:hypothetical protein
MGAIRTDLGNNRPAVKSTSEYVAFNAPLGDLRENNGAAGLPNPRPDGRWRRAPHKIERH